MATGTIINYANFALKYVDSVNQDLNSMTWRTATQGMNYAYYDVNIPGTPVAVTVINWNGLRSTDMVIPSIDAGKACLMSNTSSFVNNTKVQVRIAYI